MITTTVTLPKIEYDKLIEAEKAFQLKQIRIEEFYSLYYNSYTSVHYHDERSAIVELLERLRSKEYEIKRLKDRSLWQRILNK